MTTIQKETIEKQLSNYFSKKKEVVTAYLFGSTVRGNRRRNDLDIGVQVDDESAKKTTKIQNEIYIELSKLLNRNDIDVIILNQAPLLLRLEVLKNKKLLCEKDIQKRVDFEVSAELKFFDLEWLRNFFSDDLKKKIREGKFYYG